MTASSTPPVPVFKLYGETQHWPTPDLLHCESIAERSQLHDWHIRPHRHVDLVHILWVREGSVTLELEGTSHSLQSGTVIIVPAMSIHGFHFSPTVQGHIITLAKPLADHLHALMGEHSALRKADFYPLSSSHQAQRITTLVNQIDEEYQHPAPSRHRLLEALIQALTVELSRLCPPANTTKRPALRQSDKGQQHLERYQALIESHYRSQPNIEHLAERIGVSNAHLNMLCRQIAGRSALQLLHERILLEAKRQLTYTNMTIGQVSDSLGFSEPAYFTRFFKRNTALSPREFRLRQTASDETPK
ncbi:MULTISPECIES: helix-turn-helix domain-containing protein [unclassified Halomonas]|uniref:helix-turn-helix domain-containing protein n=1 Tax=unclassified Halomonas TaxID=2609666 RepID=UPI00054AB738|nr:MULTISPECIES: helix-turn-helix domain-containing protein [unclassified Halomonas]KHJ52614.1 AraC family transcriptional regulator [Halomonas hydrothermalis]UDM07048.1 helix-turn-helix domain-containing protein [Halomonas sp. NyZ770]